MQTDKTKAVSRQGVIRKACIKDIKPIQMLINRFARQDLMLPRATERDSMRTSGISGVYERGGRIIGCCALHFCWEELAEVKSLAVERGALEERNRQAAGGELYEGCRGYGSGERFRAHLPAGVFPKDGIPQDRAFKTAAQDMGGMYPLSEVPRLQRSCAFEEIVI